MRVQKLKQKETKTLYKGGNHVNKWEQLCRHNYFPWLFNIFDHDYISH